MKNDEKTNVMRLLESKKIAYNAHTYTADPSLSGEEIAGILGEDPAFVFKTLVTRGKTGRNYVFVIPVAAELDLKKAAKTDGEKSVEMIPQKELLPLTGYVHGGALNTLANTAVGVACCTVGARTVTLNITTDFISNLQAGHTAWAESRVKHRGHSTIVLTCDIFEKMPDGTKRPLTHSIASMYVKADDDRVPKKW